MDNPTALSNFELFISPAGQLISFAADEGLAFSLGACGPRLRLSFAGDDIVLLSEGATVMVFLQGASLASEWPFSGLQTYVSAMDPGSPAPLWAKSVPWISPQ